MRIPSLMLWTMFSLNSFRRWISFWDSRSRASPCWRSMTLPTYWPKICRSWISSSENTRGWRSIRRI